MEPSIQLIGLGEVAHPFAWRVDVFPYLPFRWTHRNGSLAPLRWSWSNCRCYINQALFSEFFWKVVVFIGFSSALFIGTWGFCTTEVSFWTWHKNGLCRCDFIRTAVTAAKKLGNIRKFISLRFAELWISRPVSPPSTFGIHVMQKGDYPCNSRR